MAFTYFFRDLQTLEFIRDEIAPVLRQRRFINIWDAGCAMGPEVYSLAIILRESMGPMIYRNIRISASDLDPCDQFGPMIREALYTEDFVKRIPKEILDRDFVKEPGGYRVCDEVRRRVHFQKHDLLTIRPVGKNFHLIVCKNVLLHFPKDKRLEVMQMFMNSLESGGYLVMEQTQKLADELSGSFEKVVSNAQIYRKLEPVTA